MDITALPTWQVASVGITGTLVLMTSLYLMHKGYFLPITISLIIAVVLMVTYIRVTTDVPSQPPPSNDSQFTVFRDMESADQTRVNPWVGFLQEDVYAHQTGPIGDFVGNDDYVKNAPLYAYGGTGADLASFIPSCQAFLAQPSAVTEQRCQADLGTFAPTEIISTETLRKNCPSRKCGCVPSANDRRKTICGYTQNDRFIQCPSDCCTPSCTY